MLKKLVNSLAVFSLVFALIAPNVSQAAGVSISTSVKNMTAGTSSATEVNANTGDDILVISKVTNATSSSTGNLAFYAKVPAGLNFVAGSGKLTYVDANGQEKAAALGDSIVSASGVMIGEVAPMHFNYVTYRVKVSGNGSLSVSNETYNGSNINLASNAAKVNISGTAVTNNSNAVNTTATTTVDYSDAGAVNQGNITVKSLVSNYTKGETNFSETTTVSRGDELYFRIAITNPTNSPVNGLAVYAQIPSGLQYVPGYSKLYFTDANGKDVAAPITDAIVSANGAMIGNLPAMHYEYVVYKVKVAANAPDGTYATGNQVFNNTGINMSDNTAKAELNIVKVTNTGNITVKSLVSNYTKGETNFSESVRANRGDELYYRIAVTNATNVAANGLAVYVQIPSGLQYVSGYSKLYYTDANGQDKAAPITDAIANATGAMIGNLPGMHYEYVVYKVKVADNAPAGTYATGNQVFNGSGINVSDNTGKIKVDVLDGTQPTESKTLSLKAAGYNVTLNQNVGYSASVNAKRGDEIKFKLDLSNAGNTNLKNVKITSLLPDGMTYIANSTKVVINGNTLSLPDSKVMNLGDLNVGTNGTIEFSAKVNSDVSEKVSQLVYSANGNADGISQVSSIVTINLDTKTSGNEELPSTGPAVTLLALILLALFTSISGYVYLKESNGLKNALKVIKR